MPKDDEAGGAITTEADAWGGRPLSRRVGGAVAEPASAAAGRHSTPFLLLLVVVVVVLLLVGGARVVDGLRRAVYGGAGRGGALDAVLVLGGASRPAPANTAFVANRCDAALAVRQAHATMATADKKPPPPKVLASRRHGARAAALSPSGCPSGSPASVAHRLRGNASSACRGGPAHDVLVETTSYDTIGNAYLPGGHTDVAGWRRLLVTSTFTWSAPR